MTGGRHGEELKRRSIPGAARLYFLVGEPPWRKGRGRPQSSACAERRICAKYDDV